MYVHTLDFVHNIQNVHVRPIKM